MKAEDIYKSQRFAGQLERYHTWPTLRRQTNAEHSWHVARIYLQLFGRASADVLTFIMYHDAGEIRSGDLPYPVKKDNPHVKDTFDLIEAHALADMGAPFIALNAHDKFKVKVCDLLEMWEYGKQEMAMGNKLALPIVTRTGDNLIEMCKDLPDDGAISRQIMKHMRDFQCTME